MLTWHPDLGRTLTYNVGNLVETYQIDDQVKMVEINDGHVQPFTFIKEKIEPYIENYHWYKNIGNKIYYILRYRIA